jgi:hypothetical protein
MKLTRFGVFLNSLLCPHEFAFLGRIEVYGCPKCQKILWIEELEEIFESAQVDGK